MNRSFLAAALLIFFTSCNNGSEENKENPSSQNDSTPAHNQQPSKEKLDEKLVNIDTALTNTALFIAGMDLIAPDTLLESFMQEEYYQSHKEFTSTTWQTTVSTMLDPISKWTTEKNMVDQRTDATCFYPLSGPDFLFANAFYPNASNYVMMGLEPRGTYPNFSKMDLNTRKDYFDVLRGSMKYLNSRGYFVTQHMGSDFTRRHLNGMVHMMIYMMAKTGHLIVDSYVVYLNDDGSATRLEDGQPAPDGAVQAIAVEFTNKERRVLKKAYYMSINVADENLANKPGFDKFIRSFANRMSYMKSASCVLFNDDFNTMRQLVLSCDRIIQDDTGIPYRYIVNDGSFDIDLYGTYTKVIKQIPWCKQPDLEKALVEEGENKDLPFKISYNGHHNEGIIIHAVRQASSDVQPE